MDRYILDTNLFFNMESGLGIGTKTEEVVVALTNAMEMHKKAGTAEFYAPPKIVDEFLSFFEDKEQPFIHAFLSVLIVKSPDLHNVQFPSAMTWQIIDETRARNYRGQTIAEEEMAAVGKHFMGKETLDKKHFEMEMGKFIKGLRGRYRQATRFGFIDSVADFELIVLAKELGANLVTADEGVVKWARLFGVTEMSAPVFGKKMIRDSEL